MLNLTKMRSSWMLYLFIIITAGLLSRTMHTGYLLFDKYLGDALYAAMVYALFRLRCGSNSAALGAAVTMTTIEVFQLTRFAVHMLTSEELLVQLAARLMGTHFGYLDLVAYAVGISVVFLLDIWSSKSDSENGKNFNIYI